MWWELLYVVLALLALVLIPLIGLYARRRWLTAQGTTFDCSLQLWGREPGVGWSLGLGRYKGEELQWFRSFSLSMRPRVTFNRGVTRCEHQRAASPAEAIMLYEGSWIVKLRNIRTGEQHNLAMTHDAAMAMLSWLEAAPPGVYHPSGDQIE